MVAEKASSLTAINNLSCINLNDSKGVLTLAESSTLKSLNLKSIWVIVVIDILLIFFILAVMPLDWPTLLNLSKNLIQVLALIPASAVGCILVKYVNDLLSPNIKAVLVFWRIRNALPGHRAFSEVAIRDPRIDMNILKERLGEFPANPIDQNTVWYQIYQTHKEAKEVREAHRNYLLFRDCASLTILIGIVAMTVSFFSKATFHQFLILIAITIVQFLICAISARNTGIRFVQNVLALECVSSPRGKKRK